MKFSLHSVLVVALCLFVGACAFKKEDAEDKQRQELADVVTQQLDEKKEKIAFEGTLTDENVKIRFDENETPGSYNLVIEWPEAVGIMEISLNGKLVGSFKEHSYTRSVQHGEVYQIALRAFASIQEGGGYLSGYGKTRTVPTDFILSTVYSLEKSTIIDADRVYLLKGSKIVTNGKTLEITTKKLYVESPELIGNEFDRAAIATFRFEHKSSDPNEISPGKISINADKAFGDLMISMIAVNAVEARLATDRPEWESFKNLPPKAADGSKGANGTLHYLRCLDMNDVPCREQQICETHPQNGGKGSNGKNGIPGFDGISGGNTGDLVISITDDSEFNASIFRKIGKRSKGSPGIPAQAPGFGGAPGNNPENLCQRANQGEPGDRGVDGANGKDGEDGKYGQITTDIKLDVRDN